MGKKRERDEQNPAHDGDKMDEDSDEDVSIQEYVVLNTS